jgi:hypothetical protein
MHGVLEISGFYGKISVFGCVGYGKDEMVFEFTIGTTLAWGVTSRENGKRLNWYRFGRDFLTGTRSERMTNLIWSV